MAKKERTPETPSDGEGTTVVEFPEKFAEFVSRNGQAQRADEPGGAVHRAVETGVGVWTLILGAQRKG